MTELAEFAPRDYRVLLRWGHGDCALLFPRGVSGELLFEAQAVPLPGAPDWFCGLIAVRGQVVPVLELADPWSSGAPDGGHILVVRAGLETIALRTQAMAGFAALGARCATNEAPPAALSATCGAQFLLEGDCPRGIEWDPLSWSQSLHTKTAGVGGYATSIGGES
jgi:hypothetical protein